MAPSRKNKGVERVGDILSGLARTGNLGAQLELAVIFERWEDFAGPRLARHGRPYRVEDGKLLVRAESPVWMSRFSYEKWRILKRINRHARKELVSDLFVTLLPEDASLDD